MWTPDIAPTHLIYLGDAATSLVFANQALTKHKGTPVLLEIEVGEHLLQADPAYLVTRQHLDRTNFGSDVESSYEWSGRVATTGPVSVRRRLVCTDIFEFLIAIYHSGLADHVQRWHDDSVWRNAAAKFGQSPASASAWRSTIGDAIKALFFVQY